MKMVINDKLVRKIRNDFRNGNLDIEATAYIYKTDVSTIENILNGIEYPWAGGPITTLKYLPVTKINLTPKNEQTVRAFLMHRWTERWINKRTLHLAKKEESRYTKKERPTDLSGGCYPIAMMCKKIFNVEAQFHSNDRHGFLVFNDGTIYDMNRGCNDVASMLEKKKKPYKIDFDRHSERYRFSSTWYDWISRVLNEYNALIAPAIEEKLTKPNLITTCPDWANIKGK